LSTARALLGLQETDMQLATRRRAYRQIVEELESEGGIPELTERLERTRVRELELKVEAARNESEAAALGEKVKQLEERLYSGLITNVRELTAIETEHNTARRELARVDEAIAPSRSAAEEAGETYKRLKAELEQRQLEWATRRKELRKDRSRIGAEYKKIGAERASATDGISPLDLETYNALLPRMNGVAVVKVDRGVCQGCRVRLPIGEISRMQNASGLVNCSSCGRILLTE
jgi:predicted  nucleic acid-binding Zn-ribbon protein